MDRERKSGWLLWVQTFILVGVVAVGAIYMNNVAERFVQQSEQRDCDGLLADIAVYVETPPATRTGLNQWRSKVKRYGQIGCSPDLPTSYMQIPSPRPSR